MQKQIQVPDEIQAKVDQFMANARARFGHGVFRMDANDQGGDQGGSQGGQGGGSDQGGSQNQDQGGSILDREAEDGDQGQGGGDQGQGGQQNGGGNVDVAEIVSQVTAALEGRFDSIADRRVNAILREVRNGQQGGGQGGQQQGGEGSGQQQSGQQSGPAAGDVREARLVYREYVGDQVRFLGDFEREAASNLAQGLIAARMGAGDDPETAGREAARQVATTVKGLRKQYESRIMAALRRDGVIPAEAGQSGQPLAGPAKPGDQSGYQAGAAKAQQLLAHRMPQTQQQ